VIIKKASIDDMIDVYSWRNDPLTRIMNADSSIVVLANHKKWFENSLINPNREMYVGFINKIKIGVTRFDLNKNQNIAEVSINLNPAMRGKRLSFSLLSNSIDFYLQNKKIKLIAKVKKKNLKSLSIFKKLKFKKYDENKIFEYLIL